jgi:hypothetical protein
VLNNSAVFIYVVDRDYGFAPNPFHGYCTLATCKPRIRNPAKIGDWVIGVGGTRLNATGRCIFAMRISDKINYDTYWNDATYRVKIPIRNGSQVMMVGDNIYHRDPKSDSWIQIDSHHSKEDGSPNPLNIENDTKSENVLISTHFYYFGSSAPTIPSEIIKKLGYKNGRFHRRFSITQTTPLLDWLESKYGHLLNQVISDPFDFEQSHERYSPK